MRKTFAAGILLGWMMLACGGAVAADAPSASDDPLLEKRVMQISEELRCLVCQNQTIADSHAELAVDLRNQVREMLRKGMTEKDIKRYMVERYGDFVLYRPPVKGNTWLLWGGPFVLLLGGLGFLVFKLRQRGSRVEAADLGFDEASVRRAEKLLGIGESPAAPGVAQENDKGGRA